MAYAFSNDTLPADIKVGNIGSKVIGEFSICKGLSSALEAVTQIVYIAPYPVKVVSVTSRFGVASSSATYMLEKLPSGTASGAGTNMWTSATALSGTADTNVSPTLLTAGANVLATGDSINLIIAGTTTGLTKAGIAIQLQRV